MLNVKGGVVTQGLILLVAVVLVFAAPPADRLSHESVKRSAPLGYGSDVLTPSTNVDPKRTAPLGYGEEILQDSPTVDPKRTAPLGYGTEQLHSFSIIDPKRKAPLGYGEEVLQISPTVDPKRTAPLGYGTEELHASLNIDPKRKAPLGYGEEVLQVLPTVDPKRTAPLGYGTEELHASSNIDPKRKAPLGYGEEVLQVLPTVDPKRTAPLGYDDDEVKVPKQTGRQLFINYVPQLVYVLPVSDSQAYDNTQSRINYNADNEQDELQLPQQPYPIHTVYFLPPQNVVSPLVRTTPQFLASIPRQQIVSTIQGYVTQAAGQAVGFVTNQASNLLPSLPLTVNIPDLLNGVVNRFSNGYQYVQQTWQNRPAFLRPTTTTPKPVIEAVVSETGGSNPINVGPDPLDPEKKPKPEEFGPL